ncbi:MAG: carbohydrate porin [Prolixibacteraceae bacterium]|nr:carbohydrate porin [Prolixibacteraceae bacterium]
MIKKYLKFGFTIYICVGLAVSAFASRYTSEKEKVPVSYKASYIADNINNISGGLKTGSSYLGMVNLKLLLDTEKAGFWEGGQLYINAANMHGGKPSGKLIGDVQVISNIEAGNHTYLQELWYRQQINSVIIIAGLQDLNIEFANSEFGAVYLNSSFGILPVISNNFNASIFPLTTLGLTIAWEISNKNRWLNALYDGSPTNFDYNPYNLKWHFNSGDGLLVISEFQRKIKLGELPGVYKIGAYCHFHRKWRNASTPDSLVNQLIGLYAYLDQLIWEHEHQKAGFFTQLGYSPSAASTNNLYFGMGINYCGLFSKKGNDTIGLACAHVIFIRETESEIAIELTYQYQLSQHFFIQPDFQYIVNPSGTDVALPNAFTANMRFGITF